MSAFWQKVDERLPFTKSERIIIAIVLLLHALPALDFLHWSSKPTRIDDERVMANLVSPDTASSKTQEPPAPMPKPKEEPKKKTAEDKSSQKTAPTQTQNTPTQKSDSNTQTQMPNAAVAPSSAGGASGTPNRHW
ncbi:MAG: hypothetical protein RJB15_101 [Pseudomonadota bacterium]